MRTNWKIVKTYKELRQLIQYCQEERVASIDFETNGTAVHADWFFPTEMGVSFRPGSGWIIPLAHKESPFKDNWQDVFGEFCRAVVENPSITKYVFNALFEYRIFLKYGYRPRGRFFDVMLMKYLLHEERPNDLKSLVDMMLPAFSGYDLDNKPGKKAKPEVIKEFWENVPLKELSQYCAGDCDFTLRIGIHMESQLIINGLYELFRNFYMPLVRVLANTVLKGVMVDRKYLKGQVISFQEKIDQVLIDIFSIPEIHDYNEEFIENKKEEYIKQLEYEVDNGDLSERQIDLREEKISRVEAGDPSIKAERKLFESINFASTLQMIGLLFESEEGFEFPILSRSDTGNPSTAEDVLLKLQARDESGFIEKLLEYRGLQKLYSTYIKGIYEQHLTPEDNVHPGYLLHGTITGRLSSRGPNFQNIPRSTTSAFIKQMFIAPKDHYFVEVDLCLIAGSMVKTPYGLIPIERIPVGKPIRVGHRDELVTHSYSTGFRETFDTYSNTGRKLGTTDNHPFKTPYGFIAVKDLDLGDTLIIDSSVIDGHVQVPSLEAWVVGYFYGDGFYSQNSNPNRSGNSYSLSFSTGLDRVELLPLLEDYFSGYYISEARPIPEAVKITHKGLHGAWSARNPKGGSHDMRIPQYLFEASLESKLHFYGGLIDSDGSVNADRIRYTSVCELFIDDLMVLANSCGIFGVKEDSIIANTGGTAFHYIVYARSSIEVLVGYSRLARKAKQITQMAEQKSFSQCRTEMVPEDVYDYLVDGTKQAGPYKPVGVTLRNATRRHRLTREAIRYNIIPHLSDPLLVGEWREILAHRYETFEEAIPTGIKEVFDLSVPSVSQFVANGFTVHNSQAELRYAAEVSKDKAMLDIFKDGKNMHVATAALMFDVDYGLCNSARKDEKHAQHEDMIKKHKSAKVLNFTIFYGAGAKKVAEFLTEKTGDYHSNEEAQGFIDKWFEAFPKASAWIKKERKKAVRDGYVTNLFGRKRRLPILANPANRLREMGKWNEALRQSVNAQIQSGSSDITQWINLKIYQAILEGKLPSYLRLVSTVHDSVEFYVHKDDMNKVLPIMLNIARILPGLEDGLGACLHRVPMKASAEYGLNWGTMYSYNPDKDKDKDFSNLYEEEYKRLYT